ncbi:MAG TPA: TIM44-like domain-containing protein [Candidatus Dormibacteraeota bacterium]|nr:TIM44-like domain-containing protein [Candidatus Dormibacteraeota bacterium]
MSESTAGSVGPLAPAVIDWDEFGGIVRVAFFTVKRALVTLRPDVARHLMTEDAWERLRAEVGVLQHDGCVNQQTGIDIAQVKLGKRDVNGIIDSVVARLMVSGIDCVVNQSTGEVVSGSRQRGDWLEDWTFERSRDPQLVEQARAPKCPTCGAPLSVNSEGLCAFCAAVVPGAKTDWLLASIGTPSMATVDPDMDRRANREADTVVMNAMAVQVAEHPWTGHDPAAPNIAAGASDGIAAILQRDGAFNPSEIVVEAREVFLKLEDSRNQLRPSAVRAMVGDALYAREVDRAAQMRKAARNEVRAYLDINDVRIVDAGSAGGWDRLVVRVSAVSARSVVDLHTGNLLEGSAVTHPWSEDLLFERRSTSTTNVLTGLLAHRCPACGEPAHVSDDGLCASCGQHVTGGEKDWVLVNVQLADGSTGAPPG